MPVAAPRVCGKCGQAHKFKSCPHCYPKERAEAESRRPNAYRRMYGPEWQSLRKLVALRDGYQCRQCGRLCYRKGDMHIDHIVPHKGNPDLFWDLDNLQVLCASCHSTKTAKEDGGYGRQVAAVNASHGS